MAKLILTKEEKDAATDMDWSDETIAKGVRALAAECTELLNREPIKISAIAHALFALSGKMNGDKLTLTFSGCYNPKTGEKLGDWKLVVTRKNYKSAKKKSCWKGPA